jgi:hypothetical protein
LPARFQPGLTLDVDDVRELEALLQRRDVHSARLYRDITALMKRVELAQTALDGGALGRLRFAAWRLIGHLRR